MPTAGISADARDDIIRRNGWALGWLATLLGIVVVFSDQDRWSAQVWHDALRVPGAPPTWGVAILAGGALMLYGLVWKSRPVYHWGCCVAFAWCVVVTSVQLYTFVNDLDGFHPWLPHTVITWILVCNPISMAAWLWSLLYDAIHNSGGTTNPMGVVIWGYVGYMYALRFKLSDKGSYE